MQHFRALKSTAARFRSIDRLCINLGLLPDRCNFVNTPQILDLVFHCIRVGRAKELHISHAVFNADLFTLSLKGTLALCRPRQSWGGAETASLARCAQGLLALLLSLKVKPYIRYLASSDAAAQLALTLRAAQALPRAPHGVRAARALRCARLVAWLPVRIWRMHLRLIASDCV
jgi:hypothetical protein